MSEKVWKYCADCPWTSKGKPLDEISDFRVVNGEKRGRCPSCGNYSVSEGRGGAESDNLVFDGVEIPGFTLENEEVRSLLEERVKERLSAESKKDLTADDVRNIVSQELLHLEEDLGRSEVRDSFEKEAFERLKSRRPLEKLDESLKKRNAYDNLVGLGMKIVQQKARDLSNFNLGEFLANLPPGKRREVMRDFLAVSTSSPEPSPELEPSSGEYSDVEDEAKIFAFSFGIARILKGFLEKVDEVVDPDDDRVSIVNAIKNLKDSEECVGKFFLLFDGFSREEYELFNICLTTDDVESFVREFGVSVADRMDRDEDYARLVGRLIHSEVKRTPDAKLRELWRVRNEG